MITLWMKNKTSSPACHFTKNLSHFLSHHICHICHTTPHLSHLSHHICNICHNAAILKRFRARFSRMGWSFATLTWCFASEGISVWVVLWFCYKNLSFWIIHWKSDWRQGEAIATTFGISLMAFIGVVGRANIVAYYRYEILVSSHKSIPDTALLNLCD